MSENKKGKAQNDNVYLAKPKKPAKPSNAKKTNSALAHNKPKKVLKVGVKQSVKKPENDKTAPALGSLNAAEQDTNGILNFGGYKAEEEKNDIVDNITYAENEDEVLKSKVQKQPKEDFSLTLGSEELKKEEKEKAKEPKKAEKDSAEKDSKKKPSSKKNTDSKSEPKGKKKNEEKSATGKKKDKKKKEKKPKKKRRTLKQWFFGLKKAVRVYLILLLVLILGLGTFGLVQGFDQSEIQSTFYEVKSDKVNNKIRIIVLTDLHLREFGENNIELINKVKALEPDAIAIVGDMVNNTNDDYSVAIKLCKELVKICDVYYSYGNHESSILLFHDNGEQFKKDLFATGVKTLDNRSMDLTVGETTISIGGFSGGAADLRQKTLDFLDTFTEDENKFTLLLCHQPEVFLSGKLDDYPVDLAFSGHTHGGQVVLPYLGGLYSSNQGFLPEYDFGEFDRDNGTKIIISRGLGTSGIVQRFNNKPEIVVVDINWY